MSDIGGMDNAAHEFTVPERGRSGSRGPILLVACAVGFYVLYFVSPWSKPVLAEWNTDFHAALEEAAATDQSLLIAFTMRGCPPCRAMESQVLGTSEVRGALQAFVPVHIDVDRQREIANRFEVFATPTYAVVDVKGNLLAQCSGYQPVDAFLEFLRRASE